MSQQSFFDENNPLLSQVTARLDTGVITEAGEAPRGALTIRTASTTLTVVLGSYDLAMWSEIIGALSDEVAGPANMPQRRVEPATIHDVVQLGKDGRT